MPTAPLPACLRPRCPFLAAPNGRGYCEQHKRSEADRGYGREHRRDRMVNRPGARCERCGGAENLQRDHRIPASLGGGEEPGNKRWLCSDCHHAVGVRSSVRAG